MGAGNYLAGDHARCTYLNEELVYANLDDDEQIFMDVLWDDLVDDIRSFLPKSFEDDETFVDGHRLISSNGFFEVCLRHYCQYLVLIVQVKPCGDYEPWEYNPLAVSKLDDTADKLFDKLHHAGFEMRVRTCAWTSGPYQPTDAAAAKAA